MPDTPSVDEKDPVVAQSLSALIVVFSLLLILSLVWAVYDEIYGLRPWKGIPTPIRNEIHFVAGKDEAPPGSG